jgi:hypothetical protein
MGRRQQHLAYRRPQRGARRRRGTHRTADLRRRRRSHRRRGPLYARAQRPRHRGARARGAVRRTDSPAPRRRGAVEADAPPVDYSALADDQRITVAGIEVRVIHTPGHSPGSVCLYAPALGAVCSGDTLSGVAPAQRAGPIRTSRRSSTRSAPGCSPCRRRRLCTPGTATTPRSAPRRRTLRTGSPTAAELPNGQRQLSCQMGSGS